MDYDDQDCGLSNRQLNRLVEQRFENGKVVGRGEGGLIGFFIACANGYKLVKFVFTRS